MPARRPEDLHRLFAEALNAGDADAVMALYEPGASLVPQPGQVATGTEAIRAALDGFLALKGTVSSKPDGCWRWGTWRSCTGSGGSREPRPTGARSTWAVGTWKWPGGSPTGPGST